MHRAHTLRGLTLGLLLLGCETSATPRPTPATPSVDKASLFGDPSLVPTRAGERARQELGLAQEIRTAIDLLPDVEQTQVNVELPRIAAQPPRVLTVVRSTAAADGDQLMARARTIALQVVGPQASIEVMVEPSPALSRPATAPPWPLAIGLLGLGFFAGVLVERVRRLKHRPARRPRARATPR